MTEPQQLVKELETLIASGDEAATKRYIVEHFRDFPKETQQDLAVALFEDAMSDELKDRESLAKLKQEAVRAIKAVETIDETSKN